MKNAKQKNHAIAQDFVLLCAKMRIKKGKKNKKTHKNLQDLHSLRCTQLSHVESVGISESTFKQYQSCADDCSHNRNALTVVQSKNKRD